MHRQKRIQISLTATELTLLRSLLAFFTELPAGQPVTVSSVLKSPAARILDRLGYVPTASAAIDMGNSGLPAPLTGRELQVLRLMAHGATNQEISGLLRISLNTVKSHVLHIFNKLGVNDRTQAAVWAVRNELL